MVTLTGTFTRLDGTPATGTVRVTPSRSPIMDPQGRIVISGPQTFPLDKDGKLAFQIPASNDPGLGPPFTYTVEALLSHNPWKISKVWIPHGSTTVDLSEIGDYTPVPGVATRVVSVPADGEDGQVLVWDGDGFSWEDSPPGSRGPEGPRGPQGLRGLTGPQGPAIDVDTGLPIQIDTTVGTRVSIGGHMVHGDTGWRNVSGLLINGWVGDSITLRRIGTQVTLQNINSTGIPFSGQGSTHRVFMKAPNGFRPSPISGYFQLGTLHSGDTVTRVSSEAVEGISLSDRETINLRGLVTWITGDSWPTVLPGTPA